jgi:antitoxin CcdA
MASSKPWGPGLRQLVKCSPLPFDSKELAASIRSVYYMRIYYTHMGSAMKPQYIYNLDAPKKPVNVTANTDLVRIAKDAGINLSQTFEDAVLDKVRSKLEEQWLLENQKAIEAYNERIEKNGVFGARKRRF